MGTYNVQMRIPAGAEFVNRQSESTNHSTSVSVYHRRSRTLHVDDTIMYTEKPSFLLKLFGLKDGVMAFHPSMKSSGLHPTADAPYLFRDWMLIPHDFGLTKPPLLDNVELVKSKTEMIDNLPEIEIVYSMLDESNNTVEGSEHPIDVHYKKLKCAPVPVDHDSEEFKLIEQYMINTHDQYTLKLRELFKTTCEGESDRFEKFQTLNNHQLL